MTVYFERYAGLLYTWLLRSSTLEWAQKRYLNILLLFPSSTISKRGFFFQYTPAVDMWSIGVILYILLSVWYPFTFEIWFISKVSGLISTQGNSPFDNEDEHVRIIFRTFQDLWLFFLTYNRLVLIFSFWIFNAGIVSENTFWRIFIGWHDMGPCEQWCERLCSTTADSELKIGSCKDAFVYFHHSSCAGWHREKNDSLWRFASSMGFGMQFPPLLHCQCIDYRTVLQGLNSANDGVVPAEVCQAKHARLVVRFPFEQTKRKVFQMFAFSFAEDTWKLSLDAKRTTSWVATSAGYDGPISSTVEPRQTLDHFLFVKWTPQINVYRLTFPDERALSKFEYYIDCPLFKLDLIIRVKRPTKMEKHTMYTKWEMKISKKSLRKPRHATSGQELLTQKAKWQCIQCHIPSVGCHVDCNTTICMRGSET